MASEERESRAVLGLLNGLAKREYFGKDEFSDEFLKAELMESASDEDFSALLSRCKSLLKNIVSGNMDVNQLDAFLTSQTKKKGGINSAQAAAFGKFWRNNKAKIHDSIVAKSKLEHVVSNAASKWLELAKPKSKPNPLVEKMLLDQAEILLKAYNVSMWGNSLRSMSWRIDIKSQSKCIDQINMPTAIVELQLAENNSDKEVELVRFEMDEEKLAKITKDLDIMEAQIAAHCH